MILLPTPATRAADQNAPVQVILDTDLSSDVDDVGAVAVLHALADAGQAEILGIGVCVNDAFSAPCLSALNAFYGRPDIPIGVLPGTGKDSPSKYARGVAEAFPHRLASAADAPEAVPLYRKLLAAAADRSVVLVSIGPLTNLAVLLDSQPDQTSDLPGRQLVEKKVAAWVCMGGTFPAGREFNFFVDTPATRRTIEIWPTPAVFSGFEIGDKIGTGAGLRDLPRANPVRKAYELFNGLNNRQSWDQTAVLYAVRGLRGQLDEAWDRSPPGNVVVSADGSDQWQADPNRGMRYLTAKMPPADVARLIEQLMAAPPKRPAQAAQ
ncbi:MAG TPA: nucleoside hydrolase [Pirellulales bacterium]|nr:nucleoside hydrolase [Pirellulales bacterium]